MDSVVHFEMPYDDQKRMAKFYESAFGWQMQILGAEMGNYVLATTVETGEAGPTRPGAINGGLYPRQPEAPQHPTFVISVEEIGGAMKRVREAGGRVLGEPVELTGVGKYVPFLDSEGNRLSLLEPVPRNWHAPKPE